MLKELSQRLVRIFTRPPRPKFTEKLIRDKIPMNVFNDRGVRLDFRCANYDEVVPFLRAKMDEELQELKSAVGRSEKTEEAGDVFEAVVGYVAMVNHMSRENALEDILTSMDNKYQDRGGFENNIILKRNKNV